MPRGELHVQLYVNYADDEKLVSVSRSARLLYVDALCQAKRQLNDGRLSPVLVEKLMYPERPATAQKVANELVTSGAWAWDEVAKVYIITSWLKRNSSRAEVEAAIEAKVEAGVRGAHMRWHAPTGRVDPKCPLCIATKKPDSTTHVSTHGSTHSDTHGDGQWGANATQYPETETETETETELKDKNTLPPAKPARRRGRPTNDPNFDRFWATYPKKADKGHALDIWCRRVTTAGTDPEVVIQGAERYRDDPLRKPDYTKNAGTWLNGLCWDDQPTEKPESQVTHGWWDN